MDIDPESVEPTPRMFDVSEGATSAEPSKPRGYAANRTGRSLGEILDSPRPEDRALFDQMKETAIGLTNGVTAGFVASAKALTDSYDFRAAQKALDEFAKERQRDASMRELLRPMPALNIPVPPRPASSRDVQRLEAKIDALSAENEELRRRVAQTDLRTERMAKHFDPPADLDAQEPGAAEDPE